MTKSVLLNDKYSVIKILILSPAQNLMKTTPHILLYILNHVIVVYLNHALSATQQIWFIGPGKGARKPCFGSAFFVNLNFPIYKI